MIDPTAAPDATYARYPSLVDRTCLVTGGADGIGAGIVTELAAQGAKVAFLDLQADKSAEVAEACVAAGAAHRPIYRVLDLRDVEAMQSAIAEMAGEIGDFAVLVNNAASDDRHEWDTMTPEYFDDRIATNLRHYVFAIQAVAPAMLAAEHGSIVNVGAAAIVYGLFGALLGLATRSSAIAIAAGIAYFLLGETLVFQAIWDSSGDWLPAGVLSAFATGGSETLSYGSAGLMTLLWGTVALVATVVVFQRRDITD